MAGAEEYTNCISAEGSDSPPNKFPEYDIKPSDGEAPASEIWGMWSTLSLAFYPPERVLSKESKEQTVCKQMTDVKLLLLYSNTWNHLTQCK